jgi:hypothetical protein
MGANSAADRIEIRVGYTDAADGLTRAAALIASTIRADHTIKARIRMPFQFS